MHQRRTLGLGQHGFGGKSHGRAQVRRAGRQAVSRAGLDKAHPARCPQAFSAKQRAESGPRHGDGGNGRGRIEIVGQQFFAIFAFATREQMRNRLARQARLDGEHSAIHFVAAFNRRRAEGQVPRIGGDFPQQCGAGLGFDQARAGMHEPDDAILAQRIDLRFAACAEARSAGMAEAGEDVLVGGNHGRHLRSALQRCQWQSPLRH